MLHSRSCDNPQCNRALPPCDRQLYRLIMHLRLKPRDLRLLRRREKGFSGYSDATQNKQSVVWPPLQLSRQPSKSTLSSSSCPVLCRRPAFLIDKRIHHCSLFQSFIPDITYHYPSSFASYSHHSFPISIDSTICVRTAWIDTHCCEGPVVLGPNRNET